MSSRSPVPNTALTPLYTSPSVYPAQANPPSQPRPILLGLRQLVQPPTHSSVDLDWLHTSGQRPWDIINMSISMESTIRRSPKSKAESTDFSPILPETRRTPLLGPSFPYNAPQQSNGAEIQQRNLCAISNVKTSSTWYSPVPPGSLHHFHICQSIPNQHLQPFT